MMVHLSAGDVTYLARDNMELSRVVVFGASDEDIAALPITALSTVYGMLHFSCPKEEIDTFVTFFLRFMALVQDGTIPYFTYREADARGNQLLCVCLGIVETGMGYPSEDEPTLLQKCLRRKARGAKFDVRRLPEELRREAPTVFINLLGEVKQFGRSTPADHPQPKNHSPVCVYRVNDGEALLVTWGNEDDSLVFLMDRGCRVDVAFELTDATLGDFTRQVGLLHDMVGWFPELPNVFRRMEEDDVREASRGDLLIITDLSSGLGMVGRGG